MAAAVSSVGVGVGVGARRPRPSPAAPPPMPWQHSTTPPLRSARPAAKSDGARPSGVPSSPPPAATGATKAELAGLEAGIAAITAALALRERLTGGGGAKKTIGGGGGGGGGHPHPSHHPHGGAAHRQGVKPREWKRVSIRGRASGERGVVEEGRPQPQEEAGEDEHGGGGQRAAAAAAKAAGEAEAEAEAEAGAEPAWSLRRYLALPVEEYSVLDPRFIRRLTASDLAAAAEEGAQGRSGDSRGGGGGGRSAAAAAAVASSPSSSSSLFRLTVPLSDVVGMDIVVEVDVAVDVDDAGGATETAATTNGGGKGGGKGGGGGVSFRADRLRLSGSALEPGGPGRALSRAEVDLRLEARLSSPPDAKGGAAARLVRGWARGGGGGGGGGGAAAAAAGSGAAADTALTRRLCLEADAAVSLRVPPPLSSAPAALLGATGSLVARLAMRSLLPPFLDLLAADYRRWALERRQQQQGLVGGEGEGQGALLLGAGGGGRLAALDEAVGSLRIVPAGAVVASVGGGGAGGGGGGEASEAEAASASAAAETR